MARGQWAVVIFGATLVASWASFAAADPHGRAQTRRVAQDQTEPPPDPSRSSDDTVETKRHDGPTKEDETSDVDTPKPAPPPSAPKLTPLAYIEALYAYNFARPSNGITNYRGFDNRHNSFTLSNVAVGADWDVGGDVTGRLVLQVGHTPSTYYLVEPTSPGTPSGASNSDAQLWKYLQEAYVGWKAPIGEGLKIDAGLFLSPIGIEALAVKDNWNWSRSNVYFALPFYHTGVRATYPVTSKITASALVSNGWNSVVDNNEQKSISAHLTYNTLTSTDANELKLYVQLLYFGGVERSTGSAEGPYWRHDFDLAGEWDISSRFAVAMQANAGWEPNRFSAGGSSFGTSWYAGAIYGRAKVLDWMYVAWRGDRFWENQASNALGVASPLFWPSGVTWVSSSTFTVDTRPRGNISIRLEYRHDQADASMYFRSNVSGDGSAANPFVPNSHTQDTLLLGATTWY